MICACALLILAGCTKFDGDVTVPAYIHLDRIAVTDTPGASISSQEGFFSHYIDAAQIVVWFEGDEAETVLGTFQLPCTVPVLRNQMIDKMRIVPVVKQNGIAATRIEYPFYEYINLDSIPLSSDSTTNIGEQDADGLWSLTTHYKSQKLMKVLAEEYFEKIQMQTSFDSVMGRITDSPTVCTGTGCGVVHVKANQSTVDFEIKNTLVEQNKTAYLYLEMDYKTDVRLSVGMRSAYYSGGSEDTQSAITLYANSEWQKIYINLGKLWSQFNYNSTFHIVFSALNTDGIDGNVYLDNVKIITI